MVTNKTATHVATKLAASAAALLLLQAPTKKPMALPAFRPVFAKAEAQRVS